MSIDRSWKKNYNLGLKKLEKGCHKEAFNFGVECLNIIKESFQRSSVTEQVKLLDNYIQSMSLLTSCNKKKSCFGCIENSLLKCFNDLALINNSKKLSHIVRIEAHNHSHNAKLNVEDFYIQNNRHDKLAIFKSKNKDKTRKLVLI
jgi:hypothetical protein